MNVPSYEALLDKETRIKVIRELCENVNKALNSQMSVAEATGTSVEAEVGKYYRYADPEHLNHQTFHSFLLQEVILI